jgi:hypothetical protein
MGFLSVGYIVIGPGQARIRIVFGAMGARRATTGLRGTGA